MEHGRDSPPHTWAEPQYLAICSHSPSPGFPDAMAQPSEFRTPTGDESFAFGHGALGANASSMKRALAQPQSEAHPLSSVVRE